MQLPNCSAKRLSPSLQLVLGKLWLSGSLYCSITRVLLLLLLLSIYKVPRMWWNLLSLDFLLWTSLGTMQHQENMRVIFDVFVSGNHIFEHYVFVMKVFQGLCLWIQVFDVWSRAIRSLSQKVGLSDLEVSGCEGHVFLKVEPDCRHRNHLSLEISEFSFISGSACLEGLDNGRVHWTKGQCQLLLSQQLQRLHWTEIREG